MILIPAKMVCDIGGCKEEHDIVFEMTLGHHDIPNFEQQERPQGWTRDYDGNSHVLHICPTHSKKG